MRNNGLYLFLHIPVLVSEALSGFSLAEVVNFARLKDGLVLLELFHGRTLAFKDLAMTCTVSFINYFLQKEKRRATVVVGECFSDKRQKRNVLPVYTDCADNEQILAVNVAYQESSPAAWQTSA